MCWQKSLPARAPSFVWHSGRTTRFRKASIRLLEPDADTDPALSARFPAAFPGAGARVVGSAATEAGGRRAGGVMQRRDRLCPGRAARLLTSTPRRCAVPLLSAEQVPLICL